MSLTLYKNAERPFYCTQAQADTLDRLSGLKKGCIGSVQGYKPTTGYVAGKTPTVNIQFISRFDYSKLNERKKIALESITFGDVAEDIAKAPKLKALSTAEALELFDKAKTAALESIEKTAEGDRSDAHRQGHDRCYIHIAEGVKVNLVGEKNADGIKVPTVDGSGYPTAAAILFSIIQLSKKVIVEGEYKVVNSGAKVLMDNVIASKMNSRSISYKVLSLKADNFDSLNVDKQSITPEDLTVTGEPSKMVALLEACGFSAQAIALIESLKAEGKLV